MLRDWGRLASLTGVAFAVLLFVGGLVVGGSTPDSDASAQHVVTFYESHRGSQQASVFLIAYALVFGLFFAAALRSFLRSRSTEHSLIGLGVSGMTVLAVGGATIAGINFAAADVPGKISPTAEQALNVLQNDVFFGLLIGTAVFLIGNGLAIARSAALPRWLGWVAFAFGIVAVTPIGWIVLIIALPLWSLIVSALMFLRQAAPAPAVAAPAAG
ncbi:MAG TPA: hypothetical protein VE985_11620 [Gaiellaceae bacterium]|nr:hypothetical protein [Gaiellaceae bacterium]